ncbi:MAG: hypothetical protein REH83_04380 [Rickettsiella sp.]|nr:hypothetical protein [Rickettsiella sp.]
METLFILAMCFLVGYLVSPLIFILTGNLAALLKLKRYEKIYEAYGRSVFGNIFANKVVNFNKQKNSFNYLIKQKNLILNLLSYAKIQDNGVKILERISIDFFDYKTVNILANFLKLENRDDIRIFSEFESLLKQAKQFYRKNWVEYTFLYRLWLFPDLLVKKSPS